MSNDSRSVRLYRRLIELCPAAFHQSDADSLEQAFRNDLDKASGICYVGEPLKRISVRRFAQFMGEEWRSANPNTEQYVFGSQDS